MQKKLFALLLLIITCLVSPSLTLGADFNNAYIRLNRAKQLVSPLPVLVTAKPVSSSTENNVKVTVAPLWSISAVASSFTVSTASLPAGVTAWPGINTATDVSGNIITFPSSDLSTSNTYGFYITGGINANPVTGTGAGYVWQVESANDMTTIDNAGIMTPIIDNDQIEITATVPASYEYYNATIASSDGNGPFAQNTVINYQITYGTDHTESITLTIQAEWSDGTIEGDGAPSVEVLDYVLGSATDAYGSTPPVIDLINQTITWTINNFPAQTNNQTVDFQLTTNENYTDPDLVNFTVSSRVNTPELTPDSTLNQSYQLYTAPTATPTPTPTPVVTATPTPVPSSSTSTSTTVSVTPTPTSVPSTPLSFKNINITQINNTASSILIELSKASDIQVAYGTSLTKLDKVVASTEAKANHLIALEDLQPNTQYYFLVSATDQDKIISSDIYTFKTASRETTIKLLVDKTFLTSQNLPIYIPNINKQLSSFIMPINLDYELTVLFENEVDIKTAYLETNNNPLETYQKIMGTSTNKIRLFEINPGEYTARLKTSSLTGIYGLNIIVQDIYGNLNNFELTKLFVNSPLTITDQNNNSIEHAKLNFYRYDSENRVYKEIQANTLLRTNPVFTDYNGQVLIVLPTGKYRVEISAFNYKDRTIEFDVGTDSLDTFPRVRLDKINVGIFAWAKYIYDYVFDLFDSIHQSLLIKTKSNNMFNVFSYFSLLFFSLLLTLFLSFKTKIPLKKLPNFLKAQFGKILFVNKHLAGIVIDKKTGYRISNANVNLFACDSDQTLGQTETDNRGVFHLEAKPNNVLLQVVSKNYLSFEKEIFFDKAYQAVKVELERSENFVEKTLNKTGFILQNLYHFLFEAGLVITLILNLFFIQSLGLIKVLPFLIITLVNIFIWLSYLFGRQIHRLD